MVSLRVPPVAKAAGREAAYALSSSEVPARQPGSGAEVAEASAWVTTAPELERFRGWVTGREFSEFAERL
jgi:hypothetical protein